MKTLNVRNRGKLLENVVGESGVVERVIGIVSVSSDFEINVNGLICI